MTIPTGVLAFILFAMVERGQNPTKSFVDNLKIGGVPHERSRQNSKANSSFPQWLLHDGCTTKQSSVINGIDYEKSWFILDNNDYFSNSFEFIPPSINLNLSSSLGHVLFRHNGKVSIIKICFSL